MDTTATKDTLAETHIVASFTPTPEFLAKVAPRTMTFHLDPLPYRIRNGVTCQPEVLPLTWAKSATILRSVYRNLRSKGMSPTSARCTIARVASAVI